jgi:NifU-like protein involved in Fe-S cluster formation
MSYSQLVRGLFEQLPRAGALGTGPGQRVHGEVKSLDRGAWVRLEARIEGGRIAECAFRAWGCPHVLAAAAQAAASVSGMPVGEEPPTDAHRLAAELDSPPEKLGRLLVVEDALRAMLAQARAVQLP